MKESRGKGNKAMINAAEMYTYDISGYYRNNDLLLLSDELCTMSNDENNSTKKLFLAIDARFFGEQSYS